MLKDLKARRGHRVLPELVPGRIVGAVGQFEVNPLDLGRGQELEAHETGLQGDVEGRPLDGHAVAGRLGDGVGLGVGGPAVVVLVHVGDVQGPPVAVGAAVGHDLIRAVGRPGHGAVVARGQDLPVLHQHRPGGPGVAGAPRAHQLGDEHEVFIP